MNSKIVMVFIGLCLAVNGVHVTDTFAGTKDKIIKVNKKRVSVDLNELRSDSQEWLDVDMPNILAPGTIKGKIGRGYNTYKDLSANFQYNVGEGDYYGLLFINKVKTVFVFDSKTTVWTGKYKKDKDGSRKMIEGIKWVFECSESTKPLVIYSSEDSLKYISGKGSIKKIKYNTAVNTNEILAEVSY